MNIDFENSYNGIMYRDTIVLLDDHTFTDDQIEEMKQTRFNNWVKAITAPPPNYMRDEQGEIIYDQDGNPIPAE
jgi:hypothetical protein